MYLCVYSNFLNMYSARYVLRCHVFSDWLQSINYHYCMSVNLSLAIAFGQKFAMDVVCQQNNSRTPAGWIGSILSSVLVGCDKSWKWLDFGPHSGFPWYCSGTSGFTTRVLKNRGGEIAGGARSLSHRYKTDFWHWTVTGKPNLKKSVRRMLDLLENEQIIWSGIYTFRGLPVEEITRAVSFVGFQNASGSRMLHKTDFFVAKWAIVLSIVHSHHLRIEKALVLIKLILIPLKEDQTKTSS